MSFKSIREKLHFHKVEIVITLFMYSQFFLRFNTKIFNHSSGGEKKNTIETKEKKEVKFIPDTPRLKLIHNLSGAFRASGANNTFLIRVSLLA